MKSKVPLFLILFIPFYVLAQTSQQSQAVEDDLGPALLIMAIVAFLGMVTVILVLFVILLIVAAIAAFLVFCGVLSISVLTGIYQRSFTKGALLFMHCAFALAGCAVGATIGLIMKSILHFDLSSGSILLIGLLAGGIIGWFVARAMLIAGRQLLQRLISI